MQAVKSNAVWKNLNKYTMRDNRPDVIAILTVFTDFKPIQVNAGKSGKKTTTEDSRIL